MNSNTLNLNILGKDNIICVSLVNATMCLNSIRKPNVPNLRMYLSFTIFRYTLYYFSTLFKYTYFILLLHLNIVFFINSLSFIYAFVVEKGKKFVFFFFFNMSKELQ